MKSDVALYVQGLWRGETNSRARWSMDYWLAVCSFTLLVIGLIMVGSASVTVAEKKFGDAFFYVWRQLFFTGLGITAGFIIMKIPLKLWQAMGTYLIFIGAVLLILVFIPGLRHYANGSYRWINLFGFHAQPSELIKLLTIFYIAGYLVRHQQAVKNTYSGFLRPLALLMVLAALLLLEPDFGTTVVILVVAMGMMWMGGVRNTQFALLILGVGSVLALLVLSSENRMMRVTSFLDPWADADGSGFQLTQALIAFGRGDWFGAGLGASVQKLFYLPEAHTDFLFAVLAEEFGLFGVVFVIALFVILVLRAFRIGRAAENREMPFAGYVAYGIGILIGLQAFFNMGVNMGALPTKGLTLPFLSYGGSSLVVSCMCIAVLLRIDFETRRSDRAVQRNRHTVW